MAQGAGRFLRDHAFFVAAAALPILVVGFFLLATAIPRFTVSPPAYDLLLRVHAYDQTSPRVAVDFVVRDGTVYATLQRPRDSSYPPHATLFLFDHATMSVRTVPLDLPSELAPEEPSRQVPVGALAARRVLSQTVAPDGYELRSQTHHGPGIVGDLFGMGRYDPAVSIVKRGRVIPIALPSPYDYQSPAIVGWLADEGGR